MDDIDELAYRYERLLEKEEMKLDAQIIENRNLAEELDQAYLENNRLYNENEDLRCEIEDLQSIIDGLKEELRNT